MNQLANRARVIGALFCCLVGALFAVSGGASAQSSSTGVEVTQSCLASRGRVDVVVTVAADGSPHTASVTVGNLAPRTRRLSSGGSARITVTGRPDGPIQVQSQIDGTVVDTRTLTINCRSALTEPTATTACLAASGRVDVTVPSGAEYTVSFPGLGDRVIKAGSSGRTTWTGRPNGTYTITAARADGVKYSLPVSVDCGGPKGIPGTGLSTERTCTALAAELRARALKEMAPLNLDEQYYDVQAKANRLEGTPVAWAVDAFDGALPEDRPNDAGIVKFYRETSYWASLGRNDNKSDPSGRPRSVAVLVSDNGVVVIDQRPRDVLLTRYRYRFDPSFDPNYPRTTPTDKTLSVEGVFVRARVVDGVIELVTQTAPQLTGTDAASIAATKTGHWTPQYTWADFRTTESGTLTDCSKTYVPEDFAGFSVLSMTSIDATTLKPTPGIGVVADEAMVLVEDDQAIVATRPWDPTRIKATLQPGVPIDEAYVTSIHDFDLSDPQRARYRASGRVRGELSELDRLDDGRLAAMSCDGASWWSGADAGGCYLATLNTIGDAVRTTAAFPSFGQRRDNVEVRFGGDLAVVAKNSATSMLVDLSAPGVFASGPLIGTSQPGSATTRWNAIRLAPDRLLLLDGSQLVLFDISDTTAPRRLSTYGDRDPGSAYPGLHWLLTYFGDSFSWDPARRLFLIAYLETPQNDPLHPDGYMTGQVGVFTIKNDQIDLAANIDLGPTDEADLPWRTQIGSRFLRIVRPGFNVPVVENLPGP